MKLRISAVVLAMFSLPVMSAAFADSNQPAPSAQQQGREAEHKAEEEKIDAKRAEYRAEKKADRIQEEKKADKHKEEVEKVDEKRAQYREQRKDKVEALEKKEKQEDQKKQ